MLVLLAVLHLGERGEPAYGSTIRDELAARVARPFARGAIYVTLDRLTAKGLLTSRLGDATVVRDHQPKRLFAVSAAGLKALRGSVGVINQMQQGLEPRLGRK